MRITANNGQQVFEHFGLLTNGNIDRLVIYGNGKKYAEIDAGRIEPKFTKPNKYGNNELFSKYYYSIGVYRCRMARAQPGRSARVLIIDE